MASRTAHFGWLISVAAALVVVVVGCGGESSSAPGTTNAKPASTMPSAARSTEGGDGKVEAPSQGGAQAQTAGGKEKSSAAKPATPAAADQGQPANRKLKHPPIELPEGPPEEKPVEQAPVPTADIVLSLPRGLAKSNTCESEDVSPEVKWGKAPPGAAELIVFAASVQPVNGKLHFDWAMAGLDPDLEGLKEGEVPQGAVLGRNGDGQNKYSICPSGKTTETYIFAVYPVSRSLSLRAGFDPLEARKAATKLTESVGIEAATY